MLLIWSGDTIITLLSATAPNSSRGGNTEITHLLYCNLTLASISAASAGTYTCSGTIIGRNATSIDTIGLQVQGLEF